jgi:hypothetical protein
MRKFRFVCEQHQEFGEKGWRAESQPGFDPLWGMAVAHDVLEHFPDGDESPADEFMALGAAYLIRGEGSYFSNKGNIHSPMVNIASDFPEIMRHIVGERMSLKTPPKTLAVPNADDGLREIIKEAKKLVKSEFDPEYDKELRDAAKDILQKALGWLRIGYRRAAKRYKGKIEKVRCMFEQIEQAADKLLKHAEEGYVLEVTVDIQAGTASARIVEPDWAEY